MLLFCIAETRAGDYGYRLGITVVFQMAIIHKYEKMSGVVHLCRKGQRSDLFQFKLNKKMLQYCQDYKYLGVIYHEKINFQLNAETISRDGGRALGGMLSKLRSYKDIRVSTILLLCCFSLGLLQ